MTQAALAACVNEGMCYGTFAIRKKRGDKMWLVENKVVMPNKYDRGIIKNEINKILNGFSVIAFDTEITFTEKGIVVNDNFFETYSGPNRTYLDSNSFEVCICICNKAKLQEASSIDRSSVIKIAKKIRNNANNIKSINFKKTCEEIDKLLLENGFKLVIIYVEKEWVSRHKKSNNKNYTTIITHLMKMNETKQNEKESGCWVLYGL